MGFRSLSVSIHGMIGGPLSRPLLGHQIPGCKVQLWLDRQPWAVSAISGPSFAAGLVQAGNGT
jgi:hypothetical protein